MKKLLIAILFIAVSCKTKNKVNALPYYNSPDFTPIWLDNTSKIDKLHHLADFEFTNQNNQKITQETFRGKIHVMNCFFSICPSLCPKIMGNMKIVQDSLKNDNDVLIASFSVMPERDNVAILRRYATDNQIIDNKWHLLTGNKKLIYETARKSYFADENLGVQKGVNDFLHTENFILVDRNLHIRGIYNGTLSLEIEKLIEDIRALKKEN